MQEDLSQLSRFIASAPDAMLVVDERGDILLANPQAHDLFRADEDALVGLTVDELVPAALRQRHAELRGGYHRAPSIRPMGEASELLAARRDGTEFPTEISLSPLAGFGGPLVLAAVRDLTARKAAERRLMEARLELDRREARERQALEINDTVVQSLVVAEYRLALGELDAAREALRSSLEAAREIITGLLGDPGVDPGIRPGDLRRRASAEVGPPG